MWNIFEGKERRYFIRLKQALPVQIKFPPELTIYSTTTHNISRSGLCIEFPREAEKDFDKIVPARTTIIIIGLTLFSDKPSISAEGVVVWKEKQNLHEHPYLIGIEFTRIMPDEADQIKDFIIAKFVKEY
jgi:c-di-GMP-binding flagellar brake protein YcgR